MSFNDAFQAAHNFFTTKTASKDALRHLKKGHEIRLLLDAREECALFFQAGQVVLEQRPCPVADVEFTIGPEAIRLLSTHAGESVAQLGIDIVKEVVAGNVKIRVCGSILRVLTGGYLGIITSGGPEFMGYLATHGLTSIGKITKLIRSLKKG